MTSPAETGGGVLVLTVGTGNRDDPESSLFEPLLMSVLSSRCNRVVLLPSRSTADLADEFLRRPGFPPEFTACAFPLPHDAELDADAAYAHFDSVLGKILQDTPAERVQVDFTRGTKAMSAAAVLAAARRSIPNLHYVDGDRDRRGTVRPGTERVRRIATATMDAHRRRDLALDLMRRGNFSAVQELLPDADPQPGAIRSAAAFYASWDRLNYKEASDHRVLAAPGRSWEELWPTPEARSWVEDLARDTAEDQHAAMAHQLRLLVVDLLANCERRIRGGHFEDACVRAYRILELIGQTRLFVHGLNSSRLDPRNSAVKLVQKRNQEKGRSEPFGRHGRHLTAPRLQVSRLLDKLGDPLASHLLAYDKKGARTFDPSTRNKSVLVHGFSAKAPADPAKLKGILSELEGLARLDARESEEAVCLFEHRLAIARSMPFAAT
jgi:CRISPR-associated protein (TIGR02710 family)